MNDKEGMAGFKEEMMNPKVLVWDLKQGRINLQLSKNQVMNADLHHYLNPKGCKKMRQKVTVQTVNFSNSIHKQKHDKEP